MEIVGIYRYSVSVFKNIRYQVGFSVYRPMISSEILVTEMITKTKKIDRDVNGNGNEHNFRNKNNIKTVIKTSRKILR